MNYGLIFAGGTGTRMNSKGKPKQFLELHGKPIIIYTIEHFDAHPEIDGICLVILKEWLDYTANLIQKYNVKKVKWLVSGGNSALESQYNGLNTIRSSNNYSGEDIILIHDGVRPLINDQLISRCITGVKEYGSAITVAPAIETIIRADKNNIIKDTFQRSECQLARAPQCFYMSDIVGVHNRARGEGIYDFVDSASMMLHYGYKLHTVEGPSENIKVTSPTDFYICRALLDAKENSQIFGV